MLHMRKIIKLNEASGLFCPKCKSDNVYIDMADDLCDCQSCEYAWYISTGYPIEVCFDKWDEEKWGPKPKKNPYEQTDEERKEDFQKRREDKKGRKAISVKESKYDSSETTSRHINIVRRVVQKLTAEIIKRGENHDASKFQEPEKSQLDYYIPLLKKVAFGSPEYDKLNNQRKKDIGLLHHFQVNRHHPEHFENGIKDMTLVDILEMFCDWYASSTRSDTGFLDGLKYNAERFHMSDDLRQIFENTYNLYFKDDKPEPIQESLAGNMVKLDIKAPKLRDEYEQHYILTVSDSEKQIIKMLDHIKTIAGYGHSFQVVVDPNNPDYERKFYIDGDGSDHILDILVHSFDGQVVKYKLPKEK